MKLIIYDFYAADKVDGRGNKLWESVGEIIFDKSYLSEAVDKNVIFKHDTFNSQYTGERFVVPSPSKQENRVPEDLQ